MESKDSSGTSCSNASAPEHAQDQRFISMFLDEARLAAGLHHQTHRAGVRHRRDDDGEFFFAMEYIHGEDLRKLLSAVAKSAHARAARLRVRDRFGRSVGLALRARAQGQQAEAAQHRPSRRLAVEHPDRLRRRGEGARLRHRESGDAPAETVVGQPQGQELVYVARAVQGQ